MRIFDENGVELIAPDYEKGYLKEDSLFIMHHEAIEAVEEKGHWKTIKEYPSGGKDVEWVVDVPKVEAVEAWDEYEEILRFVAYSKKELAERKIGMLKQSLIDTDYIAIKIVEGAATLADYAEIIEQRAAWRQEINALEVVLKVEEECM